MIRLSIIVVAYKNFDCLSDCLASIPSLPWIEVIVVNNSHQNRGFAVGCNLGARFASGKVLLFLNPDTRVTEKGLVDLVARFEKNEVDGILGPGLVNDKGELVLSSSQQPHFLSSFVVYSFLNRLFKKTSLVKNHWNDLRESKSVGRVGIVSGAAIALRAKLFSQLEGFDENFFLYWEEVDLCRRCLAIGKGVFYDPNITFYHGGGLSTLAPSSQVLNWFKETRFLFFKKHFGFVYALLLEGWLALSELWPLSLLLVYWVFRYIVQGSYSLSTTVHFAGILMVGAIAFNEFGKWGKLWSGIIAILLTLVWYVLFPIEGAAWLFLYGLIWIVLDMVPQLTVVRRWYGYIGLLGGLLLGVLWL